MKFKISTDRAIIQHITAHKEGEAVLHACVGNGVLEHVTGVVTACDTQKRVVTLQLPDGRKSGYTFDHISIPE